MQKRAAICLKKGFMYLFPQLKVIKNNAIIAAVAFEMLFSPRIET